LAPAPTAVEATVADADPLASLAGLAREAIPGKRTASTRSKNNAVNMHQLVVTAPQRGSRLLFADSAGQLPADSRLRRTEYQLYKTIRPPSRRGEAAAFDRTIGRWS